MSNREAVIVSTARTPIGKAYRGAFNATPSPTLAAHAIRAAVERAGVDPAEIDDVIIGAALQQGVQATIGRTAALRAGLPVTVAGMSIDRQCASGLMAIATAAKQVIVDRMDVCVAGGVESISMVQTPEMRLGADPELLAMHKDVYMPMIGTAEMVGKRYDIGRDRAGRLCAAVAAAHRRRPGRGQVRRRDRPGHRDDAGQGQGDRRDLEARGHDHQGRGQPRRYHAGRPAEPAAGDGPRGDDHRRQCQPAFRRRLRLGDHGGGRRRRARPYPARPLYRHGRGRHRARRDGHRPGLRGA